MQIILVQNTTHFTQYFDEVTVNFETPLHRVISLDLSKLNDGDYTLYLFNDINEELARETLRIGDKEIKEYKVEKKYTTYARK